MEFLEGDKGFLEGGARSRLDDELPGETAITAFVKSRHRWGNLYSRGAVEGLMSLFDFGEGGLFGFIGDGKACKIGERW